MIRHISKKVLLKECAVAGVSFHLKYDDEIWEELEAGQEVALVRDRRNRHDKNAVAIALKDDYDGNPDNFDFDFILGYVPRSENEEIAKMLDMGWEEIFYATLSTVKTYGNLNDRLRISLYIREKNSEKDKPNTLRIQSLGHNESVNVIEELEARGIVHFRWGGYPARERDLPEVGDEVVLLRQQSNKVMMLMMRIIAKEEECLPFIDEDDVFGEDDCVCFVLSNVCGPMIVNLNNLDFLDKDSLGEREVYERLTEEDSDALKKIFCRYLRRFCKDGLDFDLLDRHIGYLEGGDPVPLAIRIDEKQLVRDFVSDKLNGNIEALADFDFKSIDGDSRYGCLEGTNTICNYAVVKAIFSVAFGEKWRDLCIESIDDCDYFIKPIILTQRLFGSCVGDKYFMGLNQYKHVVTPDLMREAFAVDRWCRTIGNLFVVPSNPSLWIDFDNWQMRGYFDRMLKAVYAGLSDCRRDRFADFINDSLLNDFVDEDFTPKKVFAGVSLGAKDFWPTQLPLAIHEMYEFCSRFIPKRSREIINILKERL